ncbi:hypothetical protein H5410_016964 [Solanum commersonii]|uniref:Uncharacterized protein n=1 Tax=Solanum commersonii TaxID=4109 RepID=A0A9J5ZYX4_SOLCO|nr:hypothetical protein H5410_016964 [Solanum commersonii]
MDAQSPSKRFTRDIQLHGENSVEQPSFSLGLTQDFGEVTSSMSKSNAMEVKRKEKTTNYTYDNAKRKELVVSDSLEDDEDPPRPKNNKEKEKVDTCSSPPKKKSRQTVTPIQKKTPPKVISKQPCLRKSLRHANVPKRSKPPLPKRQAKQRANKEDCQDVPIEVNKERSQIMNDQADFNNSSFDLLNVIYDQTKKMEKEEFTDTNKSGSFDVNKLVVEEVFMCPSPLQMVHDDQSNLNSERGMVLHPLLLVDEHTPLPIPSERRLGLFNTSPYVTSFESESGTTKFIEGKRKAKQKEKGCLTIVISFWNSHCPKQELFYKLAYKYQLFDDSCTTTKKIIDLYTSITKGHNNQNPVKDLFNVNRNDNVMCAKQKIQADAIIDSEAPERPIRIHMDCDSSERITIN